MYFLLNMGIFQPAMLVYQRVVKLDHVPKDRGENKKHLEPPPSLSMGNVCKCLINKSVGIYNFQLVMFRSYTSAGHFPKIEP